MRLGKSSNRKLYLCIGNQSGIGVWAIIMTAKTAPANAATPITAAVFLLRFFFTALQISMAQTTQTAAVASAMTSVSHNHENSCNILIHSPYLSLANTGICLPFLSTILHYYTSLMMYRLHVSSFFTLSFKTLFFMLKLPRLINGIQLRLYVFLLVSKMLFCSFSHFTFYSFKLFRSFVFNSVLMIRYFQVVLFKFFLEQQILLHWKILLRNLK